ncbi:DUF1700 domain-containing protein, partial [Mammaliicoccus sciuri]
FVSFLHLVVFFLLASFGLGLVLFVVTYLLTKWSYQLTVKYLRWNISIVKGSAKS